MGALLKQGLGASRQSPAGGASPEQGLGADHGPGRSRPWARCLNKGSAQTASPLPEARHAAAAAHMHRHVPPAAGGSPAGGPRHPAPPDGAPSARPGPGATGAGSGPRWAAAAQGRARKGAGAGAGKQSPQVVEVSIRAPHAGQRLCKPIHPMWSSTHFNPRSPCGERLCAPSLFSRSANFNPRSPCGERRWKPAGMLSVNLFLSIHAPRAGSDQRGACTRQQRLQISIRVPRAPRGGLRGRHCPLQPRLRGPLSFYLTTA